MQKTPCQIKEEIAALLSKVFNVQNLCLNEIHYLKKILNHVHLCSNFPIIYLHVGHNKTDLVLIISLIQLNIFLAKLVNICDFFTSKLYNYGQNQITRFHDNQ